MAAVKPSFHQNHLRLFSPFASVSPVKPFHLRKTTLTKASPLVLSFGSALLWSVHRTDGRLSITRCANPGSLVMATAEASERPPFDLNLAVLLAGFAFEAYSSPPKDVGTREVDAADCQTVFLSESFVREIYDGQLFVKLKKGVDLPAMDPWGTSDPYVVMQLNGQVAKSKVKWATKEPIWNEDFILNIKITSTNFLQIAVWDANLVTPHKRMGNVGISLESLCDGKMHEVLVELEGMGGGGKIYLEVRYKSFDDIAKEKEWWRIPFISEFLMRSGLGSALNAVIGSDGIQTREFVQAAFGQLRSFSFPQVQMGGLSNDDRFDMGGADMSLNRVQDSDLSQQDRSLESSERNLNSKNEYESREFFTENNSFSADDGENSDKSEEYFWKNFADNINQTIYKKLGFSLPEVTRWDGFDLLNNLALQSQRSAESEYIESGLVTPRNTNDDATINGTPPHTNGIESSISDIKTTSRNVLNQTEAILGALMVLAATLSKTTKDARTSIMNEDKDVSSDMEVDDGIGYYSSEEEGGSPEAMAVDNKKTDEMRSLFLTAESAMEAWAMLATSLGRPSFIKSEFEKICFIDNVSTDTQVAIWRDSVQRRLVVAFRGTEQTSWKDLRTDLMLVPAGLNPERLGGDFKQEVQVHSGFLGAYDSVRIRIMTLVKTSIGFCEDNLETGPKWHVYVTGHSLGGALATLLALELSSSQMAKCGAIYVTMYNFGSPRVGNKKFAEVYNEKVKDSWRIVNHRDIIPTVPRLMGYCHVAQPVYLAAGDLKDSLANVKLLEDGYQGDIIGEATPDVIVNEFMKGEREFIDKILQTEINIFLSIRDGSALMQHMEDFYYITLLERVRSNYRVMNNSNANEADAFSA